MKALSLFFYFLAHHGAWSFVAFMLLGIVLSVWRKKFIYVIAGFIMAMVNIFTGQFANAWFVARFGVKGTAIITYATQTNSTLNDQYIWDYDVVIKTAEGKDVVTEFSTMTASLYPIRNQILIPPEGERFVIKYMPNDEKNMVIMVDESNYGKRLLIREHMEPVIKAERQYRSSPGNTVFRDEYRKALRDFISNEANAPDTLTIKQYRDVLKDLN